MTKKISCRIGISTIPKRLKIAKRFYCNGFTMIEVVMALAILVVGLLSLLSLFPVGMDASYRAAASTEAALLAQMQLENILQIYQHVDSSSSIDDINAKYYKPTPADREVFSTNGRFSWSAAVSNVSTGYLKQVNLSVYWIDRNQEQEMEFTSYVANYK